ncbi:MAG: hypothetical protein RL660_199 [Bacteroidota bacterium]|jgi:hypothetical protein
MKKWLIAFFSIAMAVPMFAQNTTHLNWRMQQAALMGGRPPQLLLNTAGARPTLVEYAANRDTRFTFLDNNGSIVNTFTLPATAFVNASSITATQTFALSNGNYLVVHADTTQAQYTLLGMNGQVLWQKMHMTPATTSRVFTAENGGRVAVVLQKQQQEFYGPRILPTVVELDMLNGDSLHYFAKPDSSNFQSTTYYDDYAMGIQPSAVGYWLWYKHDPSGTTSQHRFLQLDDSLHLVKDIGNLYSCADYVDVGNSNFVLSDSSFYIAYPNCNTISAAKLDTNTAIAHWTYSGVKDTASLRSVHAHITDTKVALLANAYYGFVQSGQTIESANTPIIFAVDRATGAGVWTNTYYPQSSTTANNGLYGIRAASVCKTGTNSIGFTNTSAVGNITYAYVNAVDINSGSLLWHDSMYTAVPPTYAMLADSNCKMHVMYQNYVGAANDVFVDQYDETIGFLLSINEQTPSALHAAMQDSRLLVRGAANESISVFSTSGAVVATTKANANGTAQINMSHCSKGIYIVRSNGATIKVAL